MKRNIQTGFTLIELLIVIVIVGIISFVAAEAYSYYTSKGRRSDGINAILAVSLAQERYRFGNPTYGTLTQVYSAATSPQGYYNLSVSNNTATAYTITATGIGNQANDQEGSTVCSPLQYTVNAGTITKTPAACWP
jgi:type IV pilus assembly protein PilE